MQVSHQICSQHNAEKREKRGSSGELKFETDRGIVETIEMRMERRKENWKFLERSTSTDAMKLLKLNLSFFL